MAWTILIVEITETACLLKNKLGNVLKTRVNLCQVKPYVEDPLAPEQSKSQKSTLALSTVTSPDVPSAQESSPSTVSPSLSEDLQLQKSKISTQSPDVPSAPKKESSPSTVSPSLANNL